MTRVPTHYDTLGVDPTATEHEIRRAYRQLARALHPDRHQQSAPAEAAVAAARMREVNAAWAVLSDPSARRGYDRGLTTGVVAPPASAPGGPTTRRAGPADRPAHYGDSVGGHSVIRGLLWLFVVGLLGAIFVFTAYAAGGDPAGTSRVEQAPATTSPVVRRGSCVDEQPAFVEVVPCGGAPDAEVVDVVPIGRPCPGGSRERYLPDQQESACLKSVSPTAPR